jgi:hypothetical protein
MNKKIIMGVLLSVVATVVYARCTTQTINQGGRMMVCTTCCDQWGNCNTTCF